MIHNRTSSSSVKEDDEEWPLSSNRRRLWPVPWTNAERRYSTIFGRRMLMVPNASPMRYSCLRQTKISFFSPIKVWIVIAPSRIGNRPRQTKYLKRKKSINQTTYSSKPSYNQLKLLKKPHRLKHLKGAPTCKQHCN